MYRRAKYNRAFTMIESMVAISILFVAITGPLALMNESIISSRIARDRIRATYLAQEGIELVRNLRDNDALQNEPSWLATIEGQGCLGEAVGCPYHPIEIDNLTGTFGVCSGGPCPNLTEEESGILSLDSINPSSLFSRTVTVTETVEDREALVVATVRWEVAGDTHEVVVEDVLLDWQL